MPLAERMIIFKVSETRTGVGFLSNSSRHETDTTTSKLNNLFINQYFKYLARRLLICPQATAWLPPGDNMKNQLPQLDMNDFTIFFLVFGLVAGLAVR